MLLKIDPQVLLEIDPQTLRKTDSQTLLKTDPQVLLKISFTSGTKLKNVFAKIASLKL